MKSKIYRIEIPDEQSGVLNNILDRLGSDSIEFVGHRDENGVIFGCAPAPAGYHVEVHEEEGMPAVYYALPIGVTLEDGKTDSLYFPPAGSLEWRNGAWATSPSYDEYFTNAGEDPDFASDLPEDSYTDRN